MRQVVRKQVFCTAFAIALLFSGRGVASETYALPVLDGGHLWDGILTVTGRFYDRERDRWRAFLGTAGWLSLWVSYELENRDSAKNSVLKYAHNSEADFSLSPIERDLLRSGTDVSWLIPDKNVPSLLQSASLKSIRFVREHGRIDDSPGFLEAEFLTDSGETMAVPADQIQHKVIPDLFKRYIDPPFLFVTDGDVKRAEPVDVIELTSTKAIVVPRRQLVDKGGVVDLYQVPAERFVLLTSNHWKSAEASPINGEFIKRLTMPRNLPPEKLLRRLRWWHEGYYYNPNDCPSLLRRAKDVVFDRIYSMFKR